MISGLIFGWGAVTWAFSGLLSMDPFPTTPTDGPVAEKEAATAGIPHALSGRVELARFAGQHPRDVLSHVADLGVKDLELTSFSGSPVYLAHLGGGDTRIITLDGRVQEEFDRQRIMQIAIQAASPIGLAEIRVRDRYDVYYLDRHRRRPLPVILARLNDAEHTRYYIDPKTARVVATYSSRNWVTRWLYHGLHSLNFPWLYNHRPTWDIVVITFMLGGTVLASTSLLLAWRVLGRTLTGGAGRSASAGGSGRSGWVG
jgi:hypothetical protein